MVLQRKGTSAPTQKRGIVDLLNPDKIKIMGFSVEGTRGYQALVTPIDIAGERLGTLVMYKQNEMYEMPEMRQKIVAEKGHRKRIK